MNIFLSVTPLSTTALNNQDALLHLQFPLSSIRVDTRHNRGISRRRCNILAGKVRQEGRIRLLESTRAAKPINLARSAKITAALGISRTIGRREQLPGNRRLDDGVDILEHIALGQDHTAGTDLESVSGAIGPVVVDL